MYYLVYPGRISGIVSDTYNDLDFVCRTADIMVRSGVLCYVVDRDTGATVYTPETVS